MMKTPICDFIKAYAESGTQRFHMPGHKGKPLTGPEPYDITEISGADSLYEANGIIRESERNAQALFGSAGTFYSTEGSSQCIRAMLYLALLYARRMGKKPLILAGRNAHKTFITGAALLDIDVEWLAPSDDNGYLSCPIDARALDERIRERSPSAVYITSPDYLGCRVDIPSVSAVCKKHGVLLIVDNAHGAYLKFLSCSEHPLDLGADLCCDSAHKTLPALTGASYLHVSSSAPSWMLDRVKDALALFGSTSPSYLILRSLDAVNAYIDGGYPARLCAFVRRADLLKERLRSLGYALVGDEPLKLTVAPKDHGYTGFEMKDILCARGVESEFADKDVLVLMLSCEMGEESLSLLEDIFASIPKRDALCERMPAVYLPERAMSVRDAMLSFAERVSVADAEGRILATPNVSCPPAVPIAVCGERIDRAVIERFEYYGIDTCSVVCE